MKLAKLIALGALVFVSCSGKPEDAIVGEWRRIDGMEQIIFFKDGTVNEVSQDWMPDLRRPLGKTVFSRTKGGSYKFIDTDHMKMDWGSWYAGPIVSKVSISADELTLTSPDGKVSKYKRTK
ncbi:MAG: hypothetical protein D4R58_02620 [Betaproteobacteria bacterium]|nr:MAG: hypothetical protein D4R58_02620 [Betaproteobacteria bacterium]